MKNCELLNKWILLKTCIKTTKRIIFLHILQPLLLCENEKFRLKKKKKKKKKNKTNLLLLSKAPCKKRLSEGCQNQSTLCKHAHSNTLKISPPKKKKKGRKFSDKKF